MAVDLVDNHRGSADKYSWMPAFDWSMAYENERWWDEVRYYVDDPWFVQVVEGGAEVARVELDDPGDINPDFTGVPTIGPERLEIQFIEVATTARGRKIGAQVVQMLAERHRDRRLFAYSEDADRFWARLGWERFDHPEGDWRALFVQPARATPVSQS